MHSFYATQINAALNLQRAALNNFYLIYYSPTSALSPSEDELPPDEELPLDEPQSDDELPLGVLLPESAEELPEVEGAEDF